MAKNLFSPDAIGFYFKNHPELLTTNPKNNKKYNNSLPSIMSLLQETYGLKDREVRSI